ncbi:hypothetical protein Tco_1035944 [Tanacetum coccineum]
MDITRAQQKALDDDLVAPSNRLKIGKCNLRLSSNLNFKEPTLQVVLDALKLTSFYKAFEITADVPEIYMQEFWVTSSRHHSSLRFKMNGKIHTVNVDNFRDMLQIFPKIPGQKCKDPPFEEEILSFIRDLGHTSEIKHVTNQAMLESEAYKTYHEYATGEKIPKPKYVKNKADPESSPKKKSAQASKGKRIKTSTKVVKPVKKKQPITTSKEKGLNVLSEISWKSSDGDNDDEVKESEDDDDQNNVNAGNEERQDEEVKEEEWSDDEAYDDETQRVNVEGEELDEEETNEEDEVNELYRDVNINLEGRDTEMKDAPQTNIQGTQVTEDTHVIIIVATPEVQQQSSSVSSGFISNMLNPNPDTGIDSILNLNTKSTSLVDVLVSMNVEMPPSSVTPLPPPTIPFIQPQQQTPIPTPTIILSTSLQNLPTFGSLFKFEDRFKALEDNFLEFWQTNQFAEALDRLRNEAQAKNEDFFNTLDENMRKIIKKQVKEQVKEQVSKILPTIRKFVNDQLEAEVLTRSSNQAKTSHAVATNLSELKLKKILIDKIENNKSIDRLIQQKTLYKALVDAYETDKDILETYGDTITFKRQPESTSAPKEKTSKSTDKFKEGSKSHHTSTGKSAQVEELIHADKDLEEPAHHEFDTGFTEDQSIDETTQHLDCTLARNEDPRESINELMETPLDFSAFVMNQLKVNTLTPELLAGPIYELMKGSCKSLVELEYFLEEVCKATTDQLDRNNPKRY